jgi:transposase
MDGNLLILPLQQEAEVIQSDIWLRVKMLATEGYSKSEIARLLDINRKTVRKALRAEKPPSYPSRMRGSKLDPFKDYLKIRLEDGVTNAVKLLREIQQRGYDGKVSILRDFLLPLKKKRQRQAWIRFETMPGEQAQVDWAHFCAKDPFDQTCRFYCFTMVLGFSRCLYAEFTLKMDLPTLLRCHINAFEYFGGHTKTILYDNMKQVILYRDETTGEPHFHPKFIDFATHYSFQPKLCRPMRPQTKGKIESGVNYLRQNFFQGERFTILCTMNGQLRAWLDSVANVRKHGTTQEVPFERLKRENLIPLPLIPYDTSSVESRIATKDCFISYKGNRYSVPFQHVRKALTVRDRGNGFIQIYDKDELIATHRLGLKKGRMIVNPAHTQGLMPSAHQRETREHLTGPVPLGEVLKTVLSTAVEKRSLLVYEQLGEEGS